ncbi:MAG: ArsR/SmtB family transcription factor [Anaerolineae bacterium]
MNRARSTARRAPRQAKHDAQAVLPFLKVMGEPNRLRIFSLLAQGESCVCDIENAVGLPQNLVSHHLGVLREAGFLRARRAGQWVYYAINKATLGEVYPALCRLFNPEHVSDDSCVC